MTIMTRFDFTQIWNTRTAKTTTPGLPLRKWNLKVSRFRATCGMGRVKAWNLHFISSCVIRSDFFVILSKILGDRLLPWIQGLIWNQFRVKGHHGNHFGFGRKREKWQLLGGSCVDLSIDNRWTENKGGLEKGGARGQLPTLPLSFQSRGCLKSVVGKQGASQEVPESVLKLFIYIKSYNMNNKQLP